MFSVTFSANTTYNKTNKTCIFIFAYIGREEINEMGQSTNVKERSNRDRRSRGRKSSSVKEDNSRRRSSSKNSKNYRCRQVPKTIHPTTQSNENGEEEENMNNKDPSSSRRMMRCKYSDGNSDSNRLHNGLATNQSSQERFNNNSSSYIKDNNNRFLQNLSTTRRSRNRVKHVDALLPRSDHGMSFGLSLIHI